MSPKVIFITILILLFVFSSCKKSYLDVPPIGQVGQSVLTNQKGVEGLLIGAYSLLDGYGEAPNTAGYYGAGSNWIFGSVCGTEAYKGSADGNENNVITPLETFIATSTNQALAEKWAVTYAGVQRSNEVIRVLAKTADVSAADRERITAEARFLRGYFHFEATKVFGKVPYVDETVTYDAGNYFLSNDTLIWPAIERDFTFAMDHLPGKMNATGRTNKYSSEAYLAKAYLFEHKYAEAGVLLEDLINNGMTAGGIRYQLLEHYSDNFNAETKNSSESVFAAQSSVNDGSRGSNGNFGDVLNYPNAPDAPGGCCGFFQPSQYLVNHFKTDPLTGLPDPDHFNDADVKNDEGINTTDSFAPETAPLDPRLDWTVGRRGIPYLDWRVHPGKDWIRDPIDTYGPYSPKKNAYSKSQLGHLTDVNFWTNGATAININLIRFADVLLWAAEAETESGSLEKAEGYVNQVRTRAANPEGWVYNYIDPDDPSKGFTNTPAAHYFIQPYPAGMFSTKGKEFALSAIRYERMLELSMEGHRLFDLVRWGIADKEVNAYLNHEKRIYFTGITFTRNKNEYFPIPQSQIDLSAGADGVKHLVQTTGY